MKDDKDKSSNTEEIKPRKWLQVVLIIIALAIVVVLINKIITDKRNKPEEKKSPFNIIEKYDFSNINIDIFNSSFENMEGSRSGFFLISDLEEVISSNKQNPDHLITIKTDAINTSDVNEIRAFKKNIESNDKYEISVDYDEDGYVNLITIELVEKDKSKAESFNRNFNHWAGTNTGSVVGMALDDVIDNNKTNNDHKVTVIYGDTKTTDPEEIKNLKKSFGTFTKYEISVNYGEDGYIYEMVIENR